MISNISFWKKLQKTMNKRGAGKRQMFIFCVFLIQIYEKLATRSFKTIT